MKKLLLLTAILWSNTALADDIIDTHLLNEMFTTVNKEYLEPVDNTELATAGLSTIHDLDGKITVSKGSDRFYIYYNSQINKIVPFPKDTASITGWVDTSAQVIEAASKLSEKIALQDFQIPDLMMKKMASKLDPYSHYYSEYNYEDTEEENAIYTLYSDRKIDDILYLRVRIFNKQTDTMVKQSLENNPDIKGVILDLRGNSGGMLNAALKVADLFCDNEIITYTAGRNNENIHYYTSKEGAMYEGPLVILVDGETASAAEVLAGGLQEQSRAKLIGTRTFGKGTIQNITQMSNGGKLVLTTEQFFTPSGKVIHQNGITPDVCLMPDVDGSCPRADRLNEDTDIQQAVKLLKNEI